jgi:hypothetical protein
MTNKQLIKKLENACVVCKDCGTKYGVYSVGCSSTWDGVCNVCGETKPVTETRDYAYLMTGIRKLIKEDETKAKIKEQSKEVAKYMLSQELPTINQHPITPPPELVQQWRHSWLPSHGEFVDYVATQSAQWGADQELEACCEWLDDASLHLDGSYLRAARRPSPKPPETIEVDGFTYKLVE